MGRDHDLVAQLQRHLKEWNPDEQCKVSHYMPLGRKNTRYDQQGRLLGLHLCQCTLTQVPWEVWQCSSLITLSLSNNQLSTLPAEVGNLSSLAWLSLSNNQLSTLPAQVGNLSSLTTLSLDNNQLSTLPAELGNLSSLQLLDLRNNQLSTLPAEVGNLSSLTWLSLDHNPLQAPPPEIVRQGVPAILAYLRSLLPIRIFYCYAHEDKGLRDRIETHLGVLKRLRRIIGWYDREIQAGTEWKQEIEARLTTADLILLLVSADFIASDYCYGVEMHKALALHRAGRVKVLPILLRPVDWRGAPFASLQMLPTGAIPITNKKWKDEDEALEDVATGIRTVVDSLCAQRR